MPLSWPLNQIQVRDDWFGWLKLNKWTAPDFWEFEITSLPDNYQHNEGGSGLLIRNDIKVWYNLDVTIMILHRIIGPRHARETFQKKKKTIIWKTWLDVQKRSVERPFRLHTWNRNIDNINLRFISRIIWLSLTNCSHNPQIPFQKCKSCIVVRRTYLANKLQSFWRLAWKISHIMHQPMLHIGQRHHRWCLRCLWRKDTNMK